MTDPSTVDPSELRSANLTDSWIALAVGFAVLALHTGIAALIDFEGKFVKYNLAAQQAVDGVLPSIRLVDLSPLYFELCLLIERLFPGSDLALDEIEWIQRLAVAASAGLLYLVLASRLSRAWALAGAGVFAFEPHVLVYERIYEPEVLLVFFLLGCMAAVERRSAGSAAVAGVFAACAIATRPTFLLLFIVLGPVFYILRGDRDRSLAVRTIAFLLPVLLCGVLLSQRSERITGDWSTPVMNPGTVFFEGNHPLSRGTSAAYSPVVAHMVIVDPNVPDEAHVRYRRVVTHALRKNVSVAEVNSFWAGKALAFIRAEPMTYLKRTAAKALRLFRDHRWHDTGTAADYEAALPPMPGVFAALSALGLLGLLWEIGRLRENLFFYAYALAQIAVMLVFYVSARQQIVMVPPLIFFAAAASRRVVQLRGRETAWLLALVLLFVLFMGRDDAVRDYAHREAGGALADLYAREIEQDTSRLYTPDPEAAAQMIAASSWLVEENPPGNVAQDHEGLVEAAARVLTARPDRDVYDEFDLATLELKAGALNAAQARFATVVANGALPDRGYDQPSDPLFYLGRIAGLQGRVDEAIAFLQRALERTPGDPYVLAEMMALQDKPELREVIHRYYSSLDAQMLLGQAYLTHGRNSEAIVELKALVKSLPDLHRGRVMLAVAYANAGRLEEGVEMYLESMRIRSNRALWSDEISKLFSDWAASRPGELDVQFQAAKVLYFHGRYRRALDLLLALEAGPGRVRDFVRKIRDSIAENPKPL